MTLIPPGLGPLFEEQGARDVSATGHYSKCGPQTGSISITGELADAGDQAPPRPMGSGSLRAGSRKLCLINDPGDPSVCD